jgi:PAS domain S-box-containing protein
MIPARSSDDLARVVQSMSMPGRAVDAQRMVTLLKSAATIAYTTDSVEAGTRASLELVCVYLGWPLAHVYLLDGRTNDLVPTNVWHIDEPTRYEPFVAATSTVRLAPGVGLPGRVLATGSPAWVSDVQADPNFPRAQAAVEAGIHAGFAFPIISSQGIEGIMEFFARTTVPENPSLLEAVAQIGLQLGHVLDRVRARDALAESEAQLSEAQRLAHMGSWHYSVDSDQLTWSTELYRIYQMDPSASPATFDAYLSRVHPDDLERVRSAIVTSIDTGETFDHEYRLLFSPDVVRWAHAHGETVTMAAGDRAVELAGFCHDITERRDREAALLESERRLAEAQRLARMGSFNWDAVHNTVTWSDELYRIYGLEPGSSPATFEGYIGKVHPDDRDRVQRAVTHTVDTMEPFEHDYRIVRANGEIRWVHARGEVTDTVDGRVARLNGYCQDVTELRQLEQTKDAILMGVSHDLRTPLTFMVGVVSLLQRPEGVSEANMKLLLERLADNARQLEQSLSDLLDVDRLSRGVVEPRMRPTAIDELVGRVVDRLRGDHVVKTDVQVATAVVDTGLVERILENLLANALRYAPSGTEICVRAWGTDDETILAVDDRGDGVPDALKTAIFEPFHRPDTMSHAPGVGVGLAVVARFAALHGGRAWVEDRDGGGSSFFVALPRSA